jgi:glycosyltransferase involved in cell wall biosynthesis
MLLNSFPPAAIGGAERQAERLAECLGQQGAKVGVLTRGAGTLPAYQQRHGFWVERIPCYGPGKMQTLTFMAGAAWSLWRRRSEYDILHAHLAFSPALIAAIMGRWLGKRVIVKFGNSGQYGDVEVSQRTRRGRLRLALFRRWVDMCIVLDSKMKAELLMAGFSLERVSQVVNGIDVNDFTASAEDKSAAKTEMGLRGKTVLVFVGRLAPQKALPVLLEALRHALSTCPHLHLLVVGDGPDRSALEQQARELSLEDYLAFVGGVSDVQRYLRVADIFVLPSDGEGISNALLEAMAMGLACVATAAGGSPEVLDNGACGLLVPPKRADLLAEAILELARHPDEAARLGAAARNRICAHYDLAIVGRQYLDLYQRLTSRISP